MNDAFPRRWMSAQFASGHGLYLLLDSQLPQRKIRQLLLQTSDFEHYRILYQDTHAAQLADNGPFVFALDRHDDKRIAPLLASPEDNWGWLFSLPQACLPAWVEHWQQRLIVGAAPHQALYRFHDNRVLARTLAHLPAEAIAAYLGPAPSVCYWEGTQWQSTDNPAPGHYPLPDAPLWLQIPETPEQTRCIRRLNAHRYLLTEHEQAYANLARTQPPQTWLSERIAQADDWGWQTPQQLEFLLTQSLRAPAHDLEAQWQVRPGETPQEHFERVLWGVKAADGEAGL
ncbi:DUF4123 domain-containing protein [Pseudomonas sp.]|jgi:hypothetical protein|uniref:DUF4123 domain-containing protein n=1 Tax=Pseudomonas sp. TaxID=306 RepID=UPI002E34EFA4|nr:DUF4123 domain-containing protein [Pseudomonas sp.]HEX4551789.1 DUF4123 domain-containing protein [Pseudomonas sp.]